MKQELRRRAKALAFFISNDWHTEVSASVCSRLYSYLSLISYQSIGLYMPMRDEVDVRPLIGRLLHEGKSVYLPRVLDQKQIAFYPYLEGDELVSNGRFALNEPKESLPAYRASLDVLIVPAVHFYKGYRLGRGKGYYDRYLSIAPPTKLLAGITLGLLEDTSFVPDDWDIPMDVVFSPQAGDSQHSPIASQPLQSKDPETI